MLKKNLCGLFAALFAAGFAGCGGGPRTYTVVDGTMLGTTLHVVADVEGVSSQELYAAVMELDREAKASMSIFDPASLLSRLNRNETDSVDRHIAFNLRLADSIGPLRGGRYAAPVNPPVEPRGFAAQPPQAPPAAHPPLAPPRHPPPPPHPHHRQYPPKFRQLRRRLRLIQFPNHRATQSTPAGAQRLRHADIWHVPCLIMQETANIRVAENRIRGSQKSVHLRGIPSVLEVQIAADIVHKDKVVAAHGVQMGDRLMKAHGMETPLLLIRHNALIVLQGAGNYCLAMSL